MEGVKKFSKIKKKYIGKNWWKFARTPLSLRCADENITSFLSFLKSGIYFAVHKWKHLYHTTTNPVKTESLNASKDFSSLIFFAILEMVDGECQPRVWGESMGILFAFVESFLLELFTFCFYRFSFSSQRRT